MDDITKYIETMNKLQDAIQNAAEIIAARKTM